MILWTSDDATRATSGRSTQTWSATGVSIDTRTLEKGDLFVALKAARDGHEFVAQALAQGAAAALVDHIPEGLDETAPLLIVADVQAALEDLGRAARARTAARVIAVTGSVGKTSTKEMLRDMLQEQGRTHASVASYNNHWGVPLTLARMPAETDFAVIEIGMNHPGEIAPLSCIAQPHVAMVTTVAAAHLAAFESVEKIAVEKASIIDGLVAQGVAVFNQDIPTTPQLDHYAHNAGVQVNWFGQNSDFAKLLSVKVTGNKSDVAVLIAGQVYELCIQSAGQHFAMNALGALACVALAGGDVARAARDISKWVPVVGRGAREIVTLPHGQIDLIDDAYNANPTSLRAAVAVLAGAEATRRIAILGDMRELGETEVAAHVDIATWPELATVDQIHTVGLLMSHLHAALPAHKRGLHCETSDQMATAVSDLITAGDCVLLKASLSIGMRKVVDAIKNMSHAALTD